MPDTKFPSLVLVLCAQSKCLKRILFCVSSQSVFSTPGYNSTWNVSLQNLDLYTSGPLQYQIRASCSAQKQCPSPSISLAGSSAGSPQLCSGDNLPLPFQQ